MKESDIFAFVNQLDNMLVLFNREQIKENLEKVPNKRWEKELKLHLHCYFYILF